MTSGARPTELSFGSAQKVLSQRNTEGADGSERAVIPAPDRRELLQREAKKGVTTAKFYGWEMRKKVGDGKLAGRSQVV
jgi:hypothetical protein